MLNSLFIYYYYYFLLFFVFFLKQMKKYKKVANTFSPFPRRTVSFTNLAGSVLFMYKKENIKKKLQCSMSFSFGAISTRKNKVSLGSQVFYLRQLQLVASQCGKRAVKRRVR